VGIEKKKSFIDTAVTNLYLQNRLHLRN